MSSIPPAAMSLASETFATVTPIAAELRKNMSDRRRLEGLGVGPPLLDARSRKCPAILFTLCSNAARSSKSERMGSRGRKIPMAIS